jgi:hypothetical protein
VLYNTTSDARLKENIVDAPAGTAIVQALQVRSFNFKSAPDETTEHGFIAQELIELVPAAVTVGDGGAEVTTPWGVDFGKLVPVLTKALQEALARVEVLEAKVTALEGRKLRSR